MTAALPHAPVTFAVAIDPDSTQDRATVMIAGPAQDDPTRIEEHPIGTFPTPVAEAFALLGCFLANRPDAAAHVVSSMVERGILRGEIDPADLPEDLAPDTTEAEETGDPE